jgi:hypothetical protein
MHVTTIRNEHAYYCCVTQLFCSVPYPFPTVDHGNVIYMAGERDAAAQVKLPYVPCCILHSPDALIVQHNQCMIHEAETAASRLHNIVHMCACDYMYVCIYIHIYI